MTLEEKQIIVVLSQQGYSSYKYAEMTGKNRRTINKFLRRRRVRGSEENLPRSWRGRKTGVRGDRIMYRMLRSDRRQSLGEITDQFNASVWPKFLLEQFGGLWALKDTKNIQFVRKLRFHLSTERKENDFVDQNSRGQWEIIGKKLSSVMRRILRLEITWKFMFGVKWMKD
jgi:transposase